MIDRVFFGSEIVDYDFLLLKQVQEALCCHTAAMLRKQRQGRETDSAHTDSLYAEVTTWTRGVILSTKLILSYRIVSYYHWHDKFEFDSKLSSRQVGQFIWKCTNSCNILISVPYQRFKVGNSEDCDNSRYPLQMRRVNYSFCWSTTHTRPTMSLRELFWPMTRRSKTSCRGRSAPELLCY